MEENKVIKKANDIIFNIIKNENWENTEWSNEEEEKDINETERILVIEPKREKRRELFDFFAEKFKVSTANNSQKGISLLRQRKYEFVFARNNLPDMNGFEILEETIKMWPDIIFVFMDEKITLEFAYEAKIRGAYNFIEDHSAELNDVVKEQINDVIKRGRLKISTNDYEFEENPLISYLENFLETFNINNFFYMEHIKSKTLSNDYELKDWSNEGKLREPSEEKILVVEPVRDRRVRLFQFFNNNGYEVVTANSQDKAIEMLKEKTFSFVFTGFYMKKPLDFLEEILKIQKIAVVFISEKISQEWILKLKKAGCYEVIENSFEPDSDLGLQIHSLIKRKVYEKDDNFQIYYKEKEDNTNVLNKEQDFILKFEEIMKNVPKNEEIIKNVPKNEEMSDEPYYKKHLFTVSLTTISLIILLLFYFLVWK